MVENTKTYEVSFNIIPTIPEEKLGEEVALIRSNIEENKGIFVSEEFPKMRQLAYSMKKAIHGHTYKTFDSAYFGWIKFDADAEALVKINTALTANGNILRFLVISPTKEKAIIYKNSKTTEDGEEEVPVVKKEEKKEVMSEAEMEKTIDELVIE